MSKKVGNNSVKKHKRGASKEPKLDAIFYAMTVENLNLTEQMILLHLIRKARYCAENKLEDAKYATFDGAGYYVRYTQEALADELNLSRPTVSKALKKLDDEGYIHNHPGLIKRGEYAYKGVAFVPIPTMKKRWAEQTYFSAD